AEAGGGGWGGLGGPGPQGMGGGAAGGGGARVCNLRFLEDTGLTQGQAEGGVVRGINPPHDPPPGFGVHTRGPPLGEPWEFEYRLRRKDGTYRWHLARSAPTYDTEGEITRWVGFAADIHVRKEAEAERQRARQRFSLALRAGNAGVWDYDPVTEVSV